MNYFSNVYQEFIFNWADNYFLRYIIFLFLFYLFFFGGGGGGRELFNRADMPCSVRVRIVYES